MFGQIRQQIYNESIDKFKKDVKLAFRSKFSSLKRIDYLDAIQLIKRIKLKYNRSINKPINMTDDEISHVAKHIASHFLKIQKWCKRITNTINSIEIFTACMVDKMATGFTIDNVELIPKIILFSRHAPDDIQFGSLPGIRCRTMSIYHRHIQSACITKNGNVRVDLKLNLSVAPDVVTV